MRRSLNGQRVRASTSLVLAATLLLAASPASRADEPVPAAPPVGAPPAGAPPSAPPQIEEAARLEAEGKRLHRLGRFEEALKFYEAAFRIHERPGLMFNMAQTHRELGRALPGEAGIAHRRRGAYLFRRYLVLAPDEPRRADVERLAENLEKEVASLLPQAPAAAAPAAPPAATGDEAPARPWYKRWYVWTIIGVAVVGGAVGGAVAATRSPAIPSVMTSMGTRDFMFGLRVQR